MHVPGRLVLFAPSVLLLVHKCFAVIHMDEVFLSAFILFFFFFLYIVRGGQEVIVVVFLEPFAFFPGSLLYES